MRWAGSLQPTARVRELPSWSSVSCLQLPAAKRQEVVGRLTAIYSILNAKGTVRQKRSRPLRAQVVLDCPKMAVRIEGRPDARVPALFELAAQQLQVWWGFGVPQNRQILITVVQGTSHLEAPSQQTHWVC